MFISQFSHKTIMNIVTKQQIGAALSLTFILAAAPPALCQSNTVPLSAVNSQLVPKQILKTGINIQSSSMSPNSEQLAAQLGLTEVLVRIAKLRADARAGASANSADNLVQRLDLVEATQNAMLTIELANYQVDFVMAEIEAEQNLCSEVLASLAAKRDKVVNRSNQLSYITNGALWAVAEGLDIPTWKRPKYSISSGTTGIIAGMVPSVASMYAIYKSGGRKINSELEPNMLAKVFDYQVTSEVDYPAVVWNWLNATPAGDSSTKIRRQQLIDRWIADSNIPAFTTVTHSAELDVLTGCVAHRKGLSIDVLNTRHVMLNQLSAEIFKMKRMLMELSMAVRGDKSV
jgi:hypothetical protein